MYERLFQDASIKSLFNRSHHGETGAQPQALASAVLAYARNIDNLGVLGGAVERIAQKHVALNILPEHYPFVAQALLGAIQDVLGEAATPRICAAWDDAYWFLAEILIGREATIYRDLANQPGGWNGWRDFGVESVTDESDIIRSFVLAPVDGRPVLAHRPGQYLGLLFENSRPWCAEAQLLHFLRPERPGIPDYGHTGSRARHSAGPRLELAPRPCQVWHGHQGESPPEIFFLNRAIAHPSYW